MCIPPDPPGPLSIGGEAVALNGQAYFDPKQRPRLILAGCCPIQRHLFCLHSLRTPVETIESVKLTTVVLVVTLVLMFSREMFRARRVRCIRQLACKDRSQPLNGPNSQLILFVAFLFKLLFCSVPRRAFTDRLNQLNQLNQALDRFEASCPSRKT